MNDHAFLTLSDIAEAKLIYRRVFDLITNNEHLNSVVKQRLSLILDQELNTLLAFEIEAFGKDDPFATLELSSNPSTPESQQENPTC